MCVANENVVRFIPSNIRNASYNRLNYHGNLFHVNVIASLKKFNSFRPDNMKKGLSGETRLYALRRSISNLQYRLIMALCG